MNRLLSKYLKILITYLCLQFVMSLTSTKQSAETPEGWFVYGNQKGHVEPCGCSPSTDFGGVLRLAVGLEKLAEGLKGTALFSVGDDYPLAPEYKAQSELIAASRVKLSVDGVLFSENEITWRGSLGSKDSTPVIASNLISSKRVDLKTQSIVKVGKLSVLGYVSPDVSDLVGLGRVTKKMIVEWKSMLNLSETSLLLFRGSKAELEVIRQANIFSSIYIHPDSESCRALPELGKSDDEEFFPLGTSISAICVPRKGQGFVRGGAALANSLAKQKPVLNLGAEEPLFGVAGPATKTEGASFELVSPVTWLSKQLDGPGPLSTQYEQYQARLRAEFAGEAEKRLQSLKATPFAGASQCKNCHKSAFEAWEASAHAHAYATLEARSKEQDGTCVGCHVLGYEDKGGFVSKKHSPDFANVQCENCHGPRLEHAKNPAIRPKATTMKACQTCHNSEHSAEFDRQVYWPKIKH